MGTKYDKILVNTWENYPTTMQISYPTTKMIVPTTHGGWTNKEWRHCLPIMVPEKQDVFHINSTPNNGDSNQLFGSILL